MCVISCVETSHKLYTKCLHSTLDLHHVAIFSCMPNGSRLIALCCKCNHLTRRKIIFYNLSFATILIAKIVAKNASFKNKNFKVKMCIKQLPICPIDVGKVLILGCMIDLTSMNVIKYLFLLLIYLNVVRMNISFSYF